MKENLTEGSNDGVISLCNRRKIDTVFSENWLRFIDSKKNTLEKLICILEILNQNPKLDINIEDIAFFLRTSVSEIEELALEMFVEDRYKIAIMIVEAMYFLRFQNFLEGQSYDKNESIKKIVMQVSVDYCDEVLFGYDDLLHRSSH